MSAPTVSIAIPCFNTERWLAGCVESALAQTWPEKEVIVVDDGSADRSPEIARGFGDRVRLIASANRGANTARNTALAHASGEWIQFLDADDYLEPQKIERQFAEAENGENADVIYSPVWIEDAGQRTPSDTSPELGIYSQWIAWRIPQTGGALWRRSALAALGGWKEDQPCCQEHELYLRALKAGLRFVFAPTPHAVYRVWSEDTLSRKDPRRVVQVRSALIDDLREWLAARELWTAQHQHVAGRACFEMARTLAKFDPDAAAAYHAQRKARGLIALAGPAAPLAYRAGYHALGFRAAEKLAALTRS